MTTAAPLPRLPENPVGSLGDLPDNPLGAPPTPPIVGKRAPLRFPDLRSRTNGGGRSTRAPLPNLDLLNQRRRATQQARKAQQRQNTPTPAPAGQKPTPSPVVERRPLDIGATRHALDMEQRRATYLRQFHAFVETQHARAASADGADVAHQRHYSQNPPGGMAPAARVRIGQQLRAYRDKERTRQKVGIENETPEETAARFAAARQPEVALTEEDRERRRRALEEGDPDEPVEKRPETTRQRVREMLAQIDEDRRRHTGGAS